MTMMIRRSRSVCCAGPMLVAVLLSVRLAGAGNPNVPEVRITMDASAFNTINTATNANPKTIQSCTVAFRYPGESTDRFKVGCQIRNHGGGAVHLDTNPKRSFRLKFKAAYGPKRLDYPVFERAPLHAMTKQGFDNIILRGGGNDQPHYQDFEHGWTLWGWTECMDEFMRATQIDMTGVGNHGTFCSLFVNGSYWGLYNLTERADRAFAAMHIGGNKDDWVSERDQEGDLSRWNSALSVARSGGSKSIGTIEAYIDVTGFADYMILGMSAGMWDWSHNNSWNVTRKSGKTYYFLWDGELAFSGCYRWEKWPHAPRTRKEDTVWPTHPAPHWDMFNGLIQNADFKRIFSDRARLHLKTSGGALTDAKMRARWDSLASFIRPEIARETARWQSSQSVWEGNLVKVRNLLSGNADVAFAAFSAKGWIVPAGPTVPGAPTGLAAAAQSSTCIRLTWQDNSGDEAGFKLDRRTSGTTTWLRVATPGANATSFTDSGLSAGTKYYYQVKASNAAGDSAYSNIAEATTPADPAPDPARWTPMVSGTTNHLECMRFADAQHGWAVGWGGTILKTTNGGNTWTRQTSGTTLNLATCFFADRLNGWAAGGEFSGGSATKVVLHTSDGGTTWQKQQTGTTALLFTGWAFDAANAILLGTGGTVYRTSDGGANWNRIYTGHSGFMVTSRFIGDAGWAAGYDYFMRTTDAGRSWQKSAWAFEPIWGSAFADANTRWLVGEKGTIYKTVNGGNSWAAQAQFGIASHCGWAVNANRVYVGTNGGRIYETTNGGASWTYVKLSQWFLSIHFPDAQHGYACGGNGVMYRTTLGDPVPQPPAAPSDLTAAASGSDIQLAWRDNSDNEAGFRIDRRQSGVADWTTDYASVAAGVTGYSDTGLPAETKFYYRVKAYNAAGNSALSNIDSATTPPSGGVDAGATWRYLKGTAEASDPPASWRRLGFDDSAWASGAAPFGYGDGPYGTTVADMQTSYTSLFLRRGFSIQHPARVSELRLSAQLDDGFVVWINGQEIARHNMAGESGTPVGFDATATEPVADATAWSVTLTGGGLPALEQTNVLAVQVCNATLDSSDLTFDAELTVARTQLPVAEDADQDAMPDEWEAACLSGLSDPSDRSDSADPDGDGLSNLEEYIAGTDPRDDADAGVFDVSMSLSGNGPVVSVTTVAATGAGYAGKARYYALQHSVPSQGAEAWRAVPGMDRIEGDGSTVTYRPAAAGGRPEQFRARVWLEDE
ncbi:MAG: CotH kinase family protein [Kiritimatiellae bacterium]|nr:CotH kinase family protein [Kiritimatiellia bacterium]